MALRSRHSPLGHLLVAAISMTMLASACTNVAQPPPSEEVATAAGNYGRAFGRVILIEDGKEVDWSGLDSKLRFQSLTFFVRSIASGEIQYMAIESPGGFFWPLTVGDYVIIGYQVTRSGPPSEYHSARLWTTFTVSRPGEAVYIGDVRIERRGQRIRVSTIDQYSEAVKREEGRIAAANLQVSKGLMRGEAETASYKWIVDVCNSFYWELKCDDNFRGVEPLEPLGAAGQYPVTQDLMPVLQWKPTSRQGVTYDIEIYESLTLRRGLGGGSSSLRGARIVHVEGLREPRYKLATPLPPGRQFQWTVRLRNGDTVSTWSTTSHFVFLLVAASRGAGQYFGFNTPDK